MKQSMKKLVAGTALVLGAFGAIAAEPIKIGSVLSVTGPAAFLGDPELKTLQLYVDDINKKGGVTAVVVMHQLQRPADDAAFLVDVADV